ncbi:MAG: hypothetical protein IPK82_03030 [Polyangiaceae bacterium]|nr:hypothetical protein [Polyangiaceae bacterium]
MRNKLILGFGAASLMFVETAFADAPLPPTAGPSAGSSTGQPATPTPAMPAPSAPASAAPVGEPQPTSAPLPPPSPTQNVPVMPTAPPIMVAPPPGPPPNDWQPGDPVPVGYQVGEQRRRWPIIGGVVVFSSVWGFCALTGIFAAIVGSNKTAAGVFIIPVAGPFINLATQTMGSDDAIFTATTGVLQTIGAGAIIAGLVMPPVKKLVPIKADLSITPTIGQTTQGVSVMGTF